MNRIVEPLAVHDWREVGDAPRLAYLGSAPEIRA